ncbi:TonB-dependent receptor family protein [Aestuariibacter salexigens]|uniref:TonB-dependent receptor family protein n=1 Tax=Aestuariibacter salexigens TaxID=226010 RepID=UPI00055058F1|nr:TonB-dependent receptor [Aestuariibacter salexigens]
MLHFSRKKGAAAYFALFTTFVCGSSLGQTKDADIERITTTATRVASDVFSLPVSVSIVSESQLNQLSSTHIQETLSTIAGANFHRGNGQEYLPALRSQVLSGAGACGGLLTLEDGIPLRAAGFCNINELFEAHTELAERIDVLKGPGSAFYGSNAIHGVVNVITRNAIDNGEWGSLELGSFGYKRAKLSAGAETKQGGIGMNVSITRDSGYRDDESVMQEKVNLHSRFETDDLRVSNGLTYTNLDQKTAAYITGFEAYKDDDIAQQNFDPEAYRKARSLRAWSRWDWAISSQSSLTFTPYLRVQSMDFRMHFLPGDPYEQNEQDSVGLLTAWRHVLNDSLSITVGADTEVTDGALRQFQPNPTSGSAFLQATVPQGLHYDYQVDATMLSPYAHVEWQQESWLFSVGLRYEKMRYEYDNLMLDGRSREDGSQCGFGGCRYSRPGDRTDSFSNLSPKLGVSYAVSESVRIYGNASRGFRAPQATELYRLQRDQQVADLSSVRADNLEVGVKYLTVDSAANVSLYRMEKDNFIFRDSNFFNVSNGHSLHSGIELESWQRLSENWQLTVAATYAIHTYHYDELLDGININGNEMDSAPRWFGTVQLSWAPSDATRVALQWQHMGKYYTDAENLHQYDGHDLLNVYINYTLQKNIMLRLRMTNLTDEDYAERADFTVFSGDRYFPGRPRQIFAGIEYSF